MTKGELLSAHFLLTSAFAAVMVLSSYSGKEARKEQQQEQVIRLNQIFDVAGVTQDKRSVITHVIFKEGGNCKTIAEASACEKIKSILRPVYKEDSKFAESTIMGPNRIV